MVVVSHYTTLGVPIYATKREIRKAYHKLFQEITNAFEVLSDPEKRFIYDCKNNPPNPTTDDAPSLQSMRQYGSLCDKYKQKKKKKVCIDCVECNGTGSINCFAECPYCQGLEMTKTSAFIQIPKGIANKHQLKYYNLGNYLPDNTTRGSLYVTAIVENESGYFRRIGDDLYALVNVYLRDALMGVDLNKTIKHLDGSPLIIGLEEGVVITPGMTLVKKNEGMPIYSETNSQRGDLYITFEVKFPTTINIPKSKKVREGIDLMFEAGEKEAMQSM
ncbi:uncharacterized protein EV154DRAFT_547555 [Mucor mucedo]|uniref:uncharacterized protein n=1 Tax=Mucor mucedo TaxID=29922 RepID=UPI002220B632|nr:uncharacterized protein EV154DRAFT_547555 [Mucor mucedo]KAI7896221.1 hypothetical protein EV154DRAFT_547555 [Mucor mucedo]